jgi:quercetin dioxygenase-like cupin family protein
MEQIHDDDVSNVLKADGVGKVFLKTYENRSTVNVDELKKEFGAPPWAVRVVYNSRFGGVLIAQNPGEGNRLHYHPDADECWVIMEGDWEWYIDGQGTKKVSKGDIVVVTQGTKHRITCVGNQTGIRFAVTKPDVDHVYTDKDY